jgi:hypothetical protein
MSIDAERLQMIHANAAFAVGELAKISGTDFGLDAASVAWSEGFIERQRDGLTAETSSGLVNVLGSYLGEAIIAAAPGAHWDADDGGNIGVAFANGDMAYPLTKVAKQLEQGLEGGESILSFYNVCVQHIATGQLGKAAASEAP